MIAANIFGRQVSPDPIKIGVAYDNDVETVEFSVAKADYPIFSQSGATAYVKITSSSPYGKIPLVITDEGDTLTMTWTVLNSQVTRAGIRAGQIQVEAPTGPDAAPIMIWQSYPFQIEVVKSFEFDTAITEANYPAIVDLNNRLAYLEATIGDTLEEMQDALESLPGMEEALANLITQLQGIITQMDGLVAQLAEYEDRLENVENNKEDKFINFSGGTF